MKSEYHFFYLHPSDWEKYDPNLELRSLVRLDFPINGRGPVKKHLEDFTVWEMNNLINLKQHLPETLNQRVGGTRPKKLLSVISYRLGI